MYDLYFNDKMVNRDKFIKDYLRFAKPVSYAVDWDVTCAMIVSYLNIDNKNFYTLERFETQDGFEHNFEFRKYKMNGVIFTKYIGCF